MFEKYENVKYVQYEIITKMYYILTFPNVCRMLFADATDAVSVVAKAKVSQTLREYLEACRFKTSCLVQRYHTN